MESQKIGFHSRTLDKFKKDVEVLLENESLRKDMGEKAKQYFNKNHDLQKSISAFEEIFSNLL